MDLRLFAIDVVAIGILAFALYVPRHRRKDLAVALVGVNVGVLAVTTALSTATVGAGLGLGLFGVLSIIRLRSTELSQVEVAYYFAALAIGLIGGLSGIRIAAGAGLIGSIVLVLAVADSARIMSRSRHMTMVVDRALPDTEDLAAYIRRSTSLEVGEVSIIKLDYVNDSTYVDLRYSETRQDQTEARRDQTTKAWRLKRKRVRTAQGHRMMQDGQTTQDRRAAQGERTAQTRGGRTVGQAGYPAQAQPGRGAGEDGAGEDGIREKEVSQPARNGRGTDR